MKNIAKYICLNNLTNSKNKYYEGYMTLYQWTQRYLKASIFGLLRIANRRKKFCFLMLIKQQKQKQEEAREKFYKELEKLPMDQLIEIIKIYNDFADDVESEKDIKKKCKLAHDFYIIQDKIKVPFYLFFCCNWYF